MEEDGAANTKEEPPAGSGGDADSALATDTTRPVFQSEESVSLTTILNKMDQKGGEGATENYVISGEGSKSVDLKDLLPQQKTRFIKLDKFGQRVQRMEDDGTVNMKKEPAAAPTPQSSSRGNSGGGAQADDARETAAVEDAQESREENNTASNEYGSLKDLIPSRRTSLTRSEDVRGVGTPPAAPPAKYGSLKDLAPTTRATWTKLDFKGGSVEDKRRTEKKESKLHGKSDTSRNLTGEGLQKLLPKKTIWTKLDFHGASVEDERRTRRTAPPGRRPATPAGEHSSPLQKFLPERTLSWRNEVQSSGSATFVRGGTGSRERRRRRMQKEVTAAAAVAAVATSHTEDVEEEADASAKDAGSVDEEKAYSNLTTLLPARTMTWKKQQIFSSGSAASVSDSVRGLREERE